MDCNSASEKQNNNKNKKHDKTKKHDTIVRFIIR